MLIYQRAGTAIEVNRHARADEKCVLYGTYSDAVMGMHSDHMYGINKNSYTHIYAHRQAVVTLMDSSDRT